MRSTSPIHSVPTRGIILRNEFRSRRASLMHSITHSTLPPSRLAYERGRGVSYIIESHVVTRARRTTRPDSRGPCLIIGGRSGVSAHRTRRGVMERDDLFVEGAPCREIVIHVPLGDIPSLSLRRSAKRFPMPATVQLHEMEKRIANYERRFSGAGKFAT